jgi:hypothetical protein
MFYRTYLPIFFFLWVYAYVFKDYFIIVIEIIINYVAHALASMQKKCKKKNKISIIHYSLKFYILLNSAGCG